MVLDWFQGVLVCLVGSPISSESFRLNRSQPGEHLTSVLRRFRDGYWQLDGTLQELIEALNGTQHGKNDFHDQTMCWWFCKFNSEWFCPFENANPTASSRMMPHWDMKCLGEKYRVSSRQIHINEPVTNTKSGCEECNLTDQRRDAGLDRNTQATTKYSANASGNIQIQIHKYNHANTNTDTNTNTQWQRGSHDRFGN